MLDRACFAFFQLVQDSLLHVITLCRFTDSWVTHNLHICRTGCRFTAQLLHDAYEPNAHEIAPPSVVAWRPVSSPSNSPFGVCDSLFFGRVHHLGSSLHHVQEKNLKGERGEKGKGKGIWHFAGSGNDKI